MMLFLFYLFILGGCSKPNGKNGPTKTFLSHGKTNEGGYYYVPLSFIRVDECLSITNRAEYIYTLNKKNIKCGNNTWCVNGEFKTNGKRDRQYYEMEHIIDQNNQDTELNGCNTKLLGNLVMAYGQWNGEVGQLNWDGVVREKTLVYGDAFHEARKHVLACCEMNNNNRFVLLIIPIIIIIALIVRYYYKK